jgi:hypothetical protein
MVLLAAVEVVGIPRIKADNSAYAGVGYILCRLGKVDACINDADFCGAIRCTDCPGIRHRGKQRSRCRRADSSDNLTTIHFHDSIFSNRNCAMLLIAILDQ